MLFLPKFELSYYPNAAILLTLILISYAPCPQKEKPSGPPGPSLVSISLNQTTNQHYSVTMLSPTPGYYY